MPIPATYVDNFTRREGEQVRHLIGMKCWCHGADGQPDPTCTQHESGGWIFADERLITGTVTAIEYRKELMATGAFNPGDCLFSPTPDVTVSEGDKIIFTWPLPCGAGDPMTRSNTDSDLLYYESDRSILCLDEHRRFWKEGRDFRLNGKRIEWAWTGKPETGRRPETGCRYTIKYQAYIEWIAFVPPVPRISKGEDIGDKVILRKKHIVLG